MRDKIIQAVNDGIAAIEQLKTAESVTFMQQVSDAMVRCYSQKGKVLVAGNGGSLCDAMHFAEELTGFFRARRPALPAIALADPGHITCVGNDLSFDEIFARGVEAHGQAGDLFVALTTSGNSNNILRGLQVANQRGLTTVAMLGKGGGKAAGMADYELIINGFSTSDRIQEAHMTAIHIMIEMAEAELFAPALV